MRSTRLTRAFFIRALVASTIVAAALTGPATGAQGQTASEQPQRVAPPSVAIGDVTVVEGSSGNRTARFTVTLSSTSTSDVTVRWATADDTATAGSDYVAASGTLRILAGARTTTINVAVKGDTTNEPLESYRIRLSSPVGATIGRSASAGRIANDDPPSSGLRVAAGDVSLVEGSSGTRNIVVPVTLSAPAPASLAVDWYTVANTATAGSDYTGKSGRLTFAAGTTTAYASVPILVDTVYEQTEKLSIYIFTSGGAVVSRAYGAIIITNDDPAPPTSAAGKLSAGVQHTCAVVSGGAVKCWGFNGDGQLGNGTYSTAYTPTTVTGLTDAKAVAAGHGHTCALMTDTTVKCWGLNTDLQLGLGVDTQQDRNQDRLTPVTVPGLTGVVAIEAGSHHTCAILTGGTVKCWGDGYGGRQGNGPSDADVASPTTVSGWANAVQISAGMQHTCGRWADGTVKCSGSNFNGELGNGGQATSRTPVPMTGISGATALGTGQFHTCVVASGVPRCSGYNFEGALGDGTQQTRYTTVPMTGVSGASAVSLGQDHTCVVLTSGGARCVGFNGSDGRLGNGSTDDSFTSVPVSNLSGATVIESGVYHTCAVVTGGVVRCWGANAAGQLGNGGGGTLTPVTVTGVTIS